MPRILAPPPSVQRRNSAAADLITFGSPESSPVSQSPPCSGLGELHASSSCITATHTTETSSTPFLSQFSASTPEFVEEIHERTAARPSSLAHHFVQPSFVPVSVVKDPSTVVYRPVFSGRPALQSAEQVADHMESRPDLDVLKVVGKRNNNNLIDLTPFDSLGTEGAQNSAWGSVLEVFDPLLSGCQQEKKATEEMEQMAVEQNTG